MTDVYVTLQPPYWKHQNGVSIQSSIDLGQTFLQMTRYCKMKHRIDLSRGEVVCIWTIYYILDYLSYLFDGMTVKTNNWLKE